MSAFHSSDGRAKGAPPARPVPLIVGLTGGVGTGKSAVADVFAELGAAVVDTDAIARRVVEPGEPALEQIRRAFGPDVISPDGGLDRSAMRRLVFTDPAAKRRLESITHPAIVVAATKQVEELRARARREGGPKVIVVEVPLLYEVGEPWTSMSDRIVVVWAPRDVQAKRLVARRGLSAAEAERMIAAQMPTDEKASRADDVIRNDGSKAELEVAVRQLWERWGLQ